MMTSAKSGFGDPDVKHRGSNNCTKVLGQEFNILPIHWEKGEPE
jgi:hypothetical protein